MHNVLLDEIAAYRENRESYTKTERKAIRSAIRSKIRAIPNSFVNMIDSINNS